MDKLKLHQLNKQKVAEREMKDIEGGAGVVCQPLNGYGYFRAQMEYGVSSSCNPLNNSPECFHAYYTL